MSLQRRGVLALDLGKTGCRAALFDDGERVAESVVDAAGALTDPDGAEGALRSLRRAVEALEPWPVRAGAVCAGLAGVFERWEQAPRIASGLREISGCEETMVTSDVVASYCGALGGARPGAVIAAGTGAVALAIGSDGSHARVDGWGYLLGDEGGGYAVGRAGISSALRAHDGRGGSEELLRRARKSFGAVESIAGIVHGARSPARTIAGFVPEVAAAARGGDESARGIWESAGRSLAETLAAASGGVSGASDISWTGGLFEAGDLLREPFERRVRELLPGSRIKPAAGDALDGAAVLARDTGGAASLVLREGKATERKRVGASVSVRGDRG